MRVDLQSTAIDQLCDPPIICKVNIRVYNDMTRSNPDLTIANIVNSKRII